VPWADTTINTTCICNKTKKHQNDTPVLKEVKSTINDTTTIVKVDVDKSPQVANNYQVQGVPTCILFKNGKPLWRNSGVIPKTNSLK
jgi:thioredoxin-like negative regulator of GroEL